MPRVRILKPARTPPPKAPIFWPKVAAVAMFMLSVFFLVVIGMGRSLIVSAAIAGVVTGLLCCLMDYHDADTKDSQDG